MRGLLLRFRSVKLVSSTSLREKPLISELERSREVRSPSSENTTGEKEKFVDGDSLTASALSRNPCLFSNEMTRKRGEKKDDSTKSQTPKNQTKEGRALQIDFQGAEKGGINSGIWFKQRLSEGIVSQE